MTYARIRQSSVDPEDYSIEWPDSSVGNFSESEARMWVAHLNEAYNAGRNDEIRANQIRASSPIPDRS
jgi:hypothetical protein